METQSDRVLPATFNETLREKGVGSQSLTDGISTATAGGLLVFHIMGALAEFERSLIIGRTKARFEAAKRQGKYPGVQNYSTLNKSDMQKNYGIGGKKRLAVLFPSLVWIERQSGRLYKRLRLSLLSQFISERNTIH
jgi:hypothetical protein